ncbi:hypothetical protein MYXE_09120 [Mycobacterium xenopi]|uniref:Uncharacterized protein n=1 Tax=Mycobacterium xenopi TaxID=1789 RepID=A0AAD1GXQ1_MYCXE|nr:hypothetical protein MYXE_07840 [Mycobacterium xenopi]BBU21123.1 hypothetical protein MYXE_09120 [Mycobacterium xenopi]
MTSPHLIDAEQLLADQLAEASPDLLRGLLSVFIHALMGAEADAICGAATASAAMSGPTAATATGIVISTPAPAPSMWPFPSCVRAAISRTGYWSDANAPSVP